jgi:hypothetical protein
MENFNNFFLIILFLIIFIKPVKSQDFLSGSELESFLDKAEEQSEKYSKVFKNLAAEEIKTKFYYKTNGKLDEKRIIKSLFIVYESPENGYSQEFRSVLEFNGKDVARDEEDIEKFFSKLLESKSANKEFEKLFKEGTRYDGRSTSWGMTLTQERPFKKLLRPFFEFKVLEKIKIEGRDVWVIQYQQIKQTPLIKANPTDEEQKQRSGGNYYNTIVSDNFQPTNPLMSGKIWLDAETAQIWRNELKINLHPEKLSKPIVSIEIFNEYQMSDFDLLLPKKFLVRSFKIEGKNDKTLSITKDVETIYEYTKFKEFKTGVKNYEIKDK